MWVSSGAKGACRLRLRYADLNICETTIDYDENKVDEAVFALLYLASFVQGEVARAWKSHDWDALDRLHVKDLISDPRTKAKSVLFSKEGMVRAERLFVGFFGKENRSHNDDDD